MMELSKVAARVAEIERSQIARGDGIGRASMNCPEHGEYMAKVSRFLGRERVQSCPVCTDRAIRRRDEIDAAEKAKHAEEVRRKTVAKLMDDCGIPRRFSSCDFAGYVAGTQQERQALEAVKGYADTIGAAMSTGESIILSGMPGTGKTHLAAAACRQVIEREQVRAVYVTCMGMIRAVRDTWRRDSETTEAQALLEFGRYADLLVIDEVGVQYGTDAEQNILFDIIDRRYREMRPTMFITNFGKDKFREAIGDRLFDRLRESGRWVAFTWESRRPKARATV